MTRHPLQNRVRPDGSIVAEAMRGLFMGNRGGKIHEPQTRTLHPTRRWSSRQWICCVIDFKQRKRTVMGAGYTELFFLDEVTALAAGHRPCFECRRADANLFAAAWAETDTKTSAPEMDRILHGERLDGRAKRSFSCEWGALPAGAIVCHNMQMLAKHSNGILQWSANGYSRTAEIGDNQTVDCLTPPGMVRVLENGYQPVWHPSATACAK